MTSTPDESKTGGMMKKSKAASKRPDSKTFQHRYEEAENQRRQILARLASLNEKARAHPAYKRALALLNPTFRKATIAQRGAILSSAQWLVDLVERLSLLV